jgi:hypothetical protein
MEGFMSDPISATFSDRLLFGLVLSIIAALLLVPSWSRSFSGRKLNRKETAQTAGLSVVLSIAAIIGSLLLNLLAGLSFIVSVLAAAGAAALLYMLFINYRQGRNQDMGLREAVQISGKVYGVTSSGLALIVAFARCSELYRDGKMNLPLTGEALTEAVQNVNLGKSTAQVLRDLARQFADIEVLAEMFADYAAMSELQLDADGRTEYAQKVAATLTALDELRGAMLEDMTITQVTRAVILYFIVPGLTLYVAFYAGGIGETLRTTLAGLVTLLINASVYVILPLITSRIEKMPKANL